MKVFILATFFISISTSASILKIRTDQVNTALQISKAMPTEIKKSLLLKILNSKLKKTSIINFSSLDFATINPSIKIKYINIENIKNMRYIDDPNLHFFDLLVITDINSKKDVVCNLNQSICEEIKFNFSSNSIEKESDYTMTNVILIMLKLKLLS